jgi:hypothetical protein
LLRQAIVRARALALERAGRSMAARMAMMAITTSNSIRVKARLCLITEREAAVWGNDPGSCFMARRFMTEAGEKSN